MSNEKNNKSVTVSKRTLAIGLIVVLLLVAGGVTLGLNWNRWFAPIPQQEQTFTPDIDPNAGDWNGQQLEDKGGASEGIKIPG